MTRARTAGRSFLIEILTEEIPARMLGSAIDDLRAVVERVLSAARLSGVPGYAPRIEPARLGTPRRLAVLVTGLPPRQPDERRTVVGPPVRAAFDGEGRPTRAAEGFARAQGVAVAKLERVATPRGECVQATRLERGLPAATALGRALPAEIESMTFPKTMRWGRGDHRFVRPVHSVLALLDRSCVPLSIVGVRSGRTTLGHRTAASGRISVSSPAAYVAALRRAGVIVDVAERRRLIERQLRAAARKTGGRIAPPPTVEAASPDEGDPELLDEVVYLVEWPTVISGTFDARFLDLPAAILVTAMRHHQKYFSLIGPDGGLLNRFLAVANATSDRSGIIRRGNEWVLQARLADARFFWEEDRRTTLGARRPELDRITFHEKLGSYAAKTSRMETIAGALIDSMHASGAEVDRHATIEAIRLCKCDLTTQMVNEFPELQGIVGGIYARSEGLAPAIASAIEGHYRPAGARDAIPATPEGKIVALADRIDSQAGLFLIGVVPTGSRDPYALRRSAQSVCRILIEARLHVSLAALLDEALRAHAGNQETGASDPRGARDALLEFYRARQQYLGEEDGLRQDSVRAALATGADDPLEARLRMHALEAIRGEPGFESLALAHKRIKNILKSQPSFSVSAANLQERAERDLHAGLEAARPRILDGVRRRDYLTTLKGIAGLRPALDRFFEEVLVMAEDPAMRRNRLALLQSIASLFTQVGDFSEITVESEPPEVTASARG